MSQVYYSKGNEKGYMSTTSISLRCVNCSNTIPVENMKNTYLCYTCFKKHQKKLENTKLNYDKRTDRSFVTYKTLAREMKKIQAEPVWERKRKENKKRNDTHRATKYAAILECDYEDV